MTVLSAEDVSTVFLVGLPDDMSERELTNMFLFCPGFECALLGCRGKIDEEIRQIIPSLLIPSASASAMDSSPQSSSYSSSEASSAQPSVAVAASNVMSSSSASSKSVKGGKQLIGLIKLESNQKALEVCDFLNGKSVDREKGFALVASLTKKDLPETYLESACSINSASSLSSTANVSSLGISSTNDPIKTSVFGSSRGATIMNSDGTSIAPFNPFDFDESIYVRGSLTNMASSTAAATAVTTPGLNSFDYNSSPTFSMWSYRTSESTTSLSSLSNGVSNVPSASVIGSGINSGCSSSLSSSKTDGNTPKIGATVCAKGLIGSGSGVIVEEGRFCLGDEIFSYLEGSLSLSTAVSSSSSSSSLVTASHTAAGSTYGSNSTANVSPSATPDEQPKNSENPSLENFSFNSTALATINFGPSLSASSLLNAASSQNGYAEMDQSQASSISDTVASFMSASHNVDTACASSSATATAPVTTTATTSSSSASGTAGSSSTAGSIVFNPAICSGGSGGGVKGASGTAAVSGIYGLTPQFAGLESFIVPVENPPCNTLYVGNLPPNACESELRDLFSKCHGFKRLSFRVKDNGPMCFVEFQDILCSTASMHQLQGTMLRFSRKGGIRLSYSKNPLGVRSSPSTGSISSSSNNGVCSGNRKESVRA